MVDGLAMPPVAEKTNGLKEECSTSQMRCSKFFFSLSYFRKQLLMLVLFDGACGLNTLVWMGTHHKLGHERACCTEKIVSHTQCVGVSGGVHP